MSFEKLAFLISGATIFGAALTIFAMPAWSPIAARVWYGSSFEANVTSALSELPDPESVCIFDDSVGLFVRTVEELGKNRIIERAAQDSTRFLGVAVRRPHFRVFSDSQTFYWSFGEKGFVRFDGDRMSLRSEGQRHCASFQRAPTELKDFYLRRYGREVSRENFCCAAVSGPI